MQLRELSNTLFSYDSSSGYFPTSQSSLSFSEVFIGIDRDKKSDGFSGNIRNFKLFSQYYDDAAVWRA